MKPWHLLAGLMAAAVLIWPNSGKSGPVDGRAAGKITLPLGHPGKAKMERVFVGGERACVIIRGDHDPVVNIGIKVHDAKGVLVAEDDGKGDIAAVIWYPAETGIYTISFTNPNETNNLCEISVR